MQYSLGLPFVLLGLSYTVLAIGITDNDVPAACATICKPLVQLSNTCSQGSSTSTDCICKNTSFDVKTIGSTCAICIQQNNKASTGTFRHPCIFPRTLYLSTQQTSPQYHPHVASHKALTTNSRPPKPQPPSSSPLRFQALIKS